jgi:CPA2 family monovalent cation:H+ antiporter-2
MHMDPIMPHVVGGAAVILLIGLLLRRLGQSHVVGYLLAGVVLGPSGTGLINDVTTITRLGEMGVILLLFFVGMEISLPALIAGWRASAAATFTQILASVACALALGAWQGWPIGRSVLLGFVISLSSTAVVMTLLQSKAQMDEPVGRDVVGVLLVQDLAVVPMVIVVGLLAGGVPHVSTVILQVIGAIATGALLAFVATRTVVHLPFGEWLRADHELQVFGAFLLCFGFALVTSVLGLSAALGAFVAGVVVGAAQETDWVHRALHPLHVLFLAIFFVSVGMLLDLQFLWQHGVIVVALLGAVLAVNTVVNVLIFRGLGRTWRDALYGGVLLSQVGEFSFVLAAVGFDTALIGGFGYQVTLAVITLSLIVSPACIALADRYRHAG